MRTLVLGVAFAGLVALVTDRLSPRHDVLDYDFTAERVASESHKAEFEFEAPDRQKTIEAQEAAMARVPDIYQVDEDRVRRLSAQVSGRIEALRAHAEAVEREIHTALLDASHEQSVSEVVWRAVSQYAATLSEEPEFADMEDPGALAIWLLPKPESIPQRVITQAEAPGGQTEMTLAAPEAPFEFAHFELLEEVTERTLRQVLEYGVLSERTAAVTPEDRRISILRRGPENGTPRIEEAQLRQLPTPENARDDFLERELNEVLQEVRAQVTEAVDWSRIERGVLAMARTGVADTLHFDSVETSKARELARTATEPVLKKILKGEIIQEEGKLWTEQAKSDARVYYELKQSGQEPYTAVLRTLFGNMMFVALVLWALNRAISLGVSRPQTALRYLTLSLLLMGGVAGLGRVISYFDPTGFVTPITAAAVLMTILANARLASIVAILSAFLLSIQYNYSWELLVVSATMSVAGIFSIYRVRKRSDMTSAMLKATAMGLAVAFALTLVTGSAVNETLLNRLTLIVLNGLACMFLVPGLLSPLEKLFGITTDIQLLEYSDLNNEVLSRLAMEVPATYAHSLMLGQLAEAAADAIGANGLLARVCAYYHDIGKMRRPEYFVENQTGMNIHDTLTPRLSARAIASHVTEGAEMAREYHLPKPIINGILEHHGTCLIGFFHQLALEQQKHGDVREKDFRYPGPRPKSRETAILMICDAVESGIRSIKNPNEERVREFVDKIIASRASDRQFDECHLTLRDLDTIAEVVTKRLCSSLHTRIAYPETSREAKEPKANIIPMSGGQES